MRLIFMGTPDFAVGTLEALVEAGHQVVLAVTQPDKPKGRGNKIQEPPVKEAAKRMGIPVFQPDKIRKPEHVERVLDLKPQAIIVVAFGQLLPKALLETPEYGCLNVHASLLPKYRGAAPIQWAVINGEEETGITIIRLDEGLDTGDILSAEKIKLSPDETGGSLFDKLQSVGARLCVETLTELQEGRIVPQAQKEEEATKTGLIHKKMGELDFTRSAKELERLIRGLDPWPSAFTFVQGKQLKVWKAQVLKEDTSFGDHEIGRVLEISPRGIQIGCRVGILNLREIQLEGKKRLPVEEFMKGCHLELGQKLGRE